MAAGQRMNDGPKTYDHTSMPKASRMLLSDLLPPKSQRGTYAGKRMLERAFERNKLAHS